MILEIFGQKSVLFFNHFTRDELRAFAKKHHIRIGQNKSDTISNIIEAGGFVTAKNLKLSMLKKGK